MSDQFQEDYARDIWGEDDVITTNGTSDNWGNSIIVWDTPIRDEGNSGSKPYSGYNTSITMMSDTQQLLELLVQLIDILKPTIKHEGILNKLKQIEELSGRFETPIEDPEDDLYKID